MLAGLEGNVDAFIAAAQASCAADNLAGDIAERLITHGRAAEGLAWLERAPARHEDENTQRADLRVAALDALGRRDEAQALRWQAFSRWLSARTCVLTCVACRTSTMWKQRTAR